MSQWYNRVVNNIAEIPAFITYYESELQEAKLECSVKGIVEKNITALPGITEQRFNQLQEIEAILEYLNIELLNSVRFVYIYLLELFPDVFHKIFKFYICSFSFLWCCKLSSLLI